METRLPANLPEEGISLGHISRSALIALVLMTIGFFVHVFLAGGVIWAVCHFAAIPLFHVGAPGYWTIVGCYLAVAAAVGALRLMRT